MSTSGTFTFGQSSGEVTMQAFSRLGIRRTQVSQEHLADAQAELNLLAVEWANKGPNLWTVDLLSVPLLQGVASYSIDPATVMVLDAAITTGSPPSDRVITGVSRTEYASYPNKSQQGTPTVYWFDRTVTPTITTWPVADASNTYVLNFYRYRQTQDSILAGGLSPEVPYRWLDALIWGLAERLAFIYAPEKLALVAPRSNLAYEIAAGQDTEDAPIDMTIDVAGYWR